MYCLLDDYEFQGQWWGPAGRQDRNTYSGKLSFSGQTGGLKLDLDGLFENVWEWSYEDSVLGPVTRQDRQTCYELDAILGEDANGTNVSLVQCNLSHGNEHFGETTTRSASYGGRVAIIGSHALSYHELNYTQAKISFTGVAADDLGRWTRQESLKWQIESDSWLSADGKTGFNGLAIFEYGSKSEQNIEWFFNQAFWLQSLFTVLQGAPCAIASLQLKTSGGETCDALFSKDRRGIELIQPDPLIPLGRLSRAEFESAMQKWLSASEKFKAAIYHFNSSMQFASPKHQVNLINVSQALEAFHREIFSGEDGCYIPAADYQKLQDELNAVVGSNLKALADQYRQGLDAEEFIAIRDLIGSLKSSLTKGRIRFGNEKSQARRLTELLRRLNGSLPGLLKPIMEKALDFERKIVDTRNYYIHFADEDNKRLTELSIAFAVMAIESIFIALVLTESGINASLVELQIRRSRRWQNFLHALANKQHLFITEGQRHHEISKIAYAKWEESEHAHGHDKQHWFAAVKEFDSY